MRMIFNHLNRFVTIVALCLLVFQSASAQNPSASPQSAQQIAAKVDEYMNAAVRVYRFSGSILVARDSQTIMSKGYGMANYELHVPNTPQTVFRLGSNTKSFTATAIMMLQERGKFNVNDSICKYLSDCPAAWQPITIRNLLTHTSGIPNYTALPDFGKTMSLPVTHASLINRFKDKPPEFAPGEKYNYSNSGYYLLGVIIERASGKSYADFLQENIFAPLGMTQTGYDNSSRVIKNRAAGYVAQGDSFANASYIDMTIPFAAGALYSSVEDLLRFDKALNTEKLLSRKSLDEMFTPLKNEYGYGWEIRKQLERQLIEHGGSINGFQSSLSRFPADRETVIVLSNNGSLSTRGIAQDLAAIVFGAPYKIPQERKAIALDAKTLEKYVGQFQPASGSILTVTLENGKLMRQVGAQPRVELFAESETEFFLKGTDVQITFVKDAQGRVTGQLVRRNGRETLVPKIK
ncbi:MAG: serine hydrolase [Acidobacteria bacterium]|nr:serine hydrolase [Acidobacteriota bacterium]